MMKKLTIVTVNYNHCEGLRRTMESVFRQTCHDYEYIVIDGGSTDGSADLLRMSAGRIDYWVSEPDRGIYHAKNKGVARATGEYLLFLNSGDVLHDDKVLADMVGGGELDSDIVTGCSLYVPNGGISRLHDKPVALMDFWYKNPINHQSAFIRRSLQEAFPYDETLKVNSDWKFFFHAIFIRNCSLKRVDRVVVDYEGGGVSEKDKKLNNAEHESCNREVLSPAALHECARLAADRGYDGFYLRLRTLRYSGWVYTVSVLFVRLLSLLVPSARFAREFPVRLK